ncbi:50S ribosomal protein L23 [Candidatus Woesearchaeota archaeon]|nr:50S ribosomal protein L23 [Candidatus Woesearchaeota archaeon]
MATTTQTQTQSDRFASLREAGFDPHQVLHHPLSTEKCIRQIEFDNKLSFVVHSRATKLDVKVAVEMLFKVKVLKVNIQNSIRGEKRAVVRLHPSTPASDISSDLGLI